MTKKVNVFEDAFRTINRLYTHRKGQEVPAAVTDTIEALFKDDLKPLVVKKYHNETGWTLVIHLPPGVTYGAFKDREQFFADATHSAVQIEKFGTKVKMQVMSEELRDRYIYKFDYDNYQEMYLPIPIGYSAKGFIVKDLSSMVNLFIAGTPGAGKSNFLHNLAVSLLLSRNVYMTIIDLKKLEFSYLKNHALLATSLDQARMILQAINQELDKRLNVLESAGVVKIQDFNIHTNAHEMPFIIAIIDELAELQDEQCQTLLNRIVRLGRAAGVCVIAATQRPSSTLFAKFGDSKAMFPASVCFAVRDAVNSRMVLDNDKAALIEKIKGRAIFSWDEELEVQTMFLSVSHARKLLDNVQREVLPYDIATCQRLLPR